MHHGVGNLGPRPARRGLGGRVTVPGVTHPTGGTWWERPVSRRGMLRTSAALGVGGALVGSGLLDAAAWAAAPVGPGLRPNPKLPEGTDTLPEIEHIIVLMMENHSFDNYFGMLGRGDGFPLDKHGKPSAVNPDGTGNFVHAFPMPSTCQLRAQPSQVWNASHIAMDGRKNDGFVLGGGAVAMGYWMPDDLPFYSGLARTFPLADRWFASVPAQTFPNRRFLLAATASGHIRNDFNVSPGPPNGTILDKLDKHGITWRNYYSSLPTAALFPDSIGESADNLLKIDQYFTDAAAGTLPSFALVDPDFEEQSEENPQDIRVGEQFAAKVINAAMDGPAWSKTLLIYCYDEHGGYYDHVPAPRAIAPDDIPPMTTVPPDAPGGYDRYGFRVPAVIVSPYAKRDHVSHTVYDHTSILKLVETKWNLPALTQRDAHANNLLDCLDLKGKPAFLKPPKLPEPSLTKNAAACAPIDAASIPPASALSPAPASTVTTTTVAAPAG
jgi:phospholipase C